jgi:conjugal transfer pilus assembly protein TraW
MSPKLLLKVILSIILLCVGLIFQALHAKNFGVRGVTWQIKEQNLIDVLSQKAAKQDIRSLQEKMREKAKSQSLRPTPLNLPRAEKTTHHEYVPVTTLGQDLKDDKGRIFAKKGSSINVLSKMPLFATKLLFINADDAAQIKFAQKIIQENTALKVILTGGNILDTTNILQVPVYFDQQGKITDKLGITHLPAFVTRVDLSLDVAQIAILEDGNEI